MPILGSWALMESHVYLRDLQVIGTPKGLPSVSMNWNRRSSEMIDEAELDAIIPAVRQY